MRVCDLLARILAYAATQHHNVRNPWVPMPAITFQCGDCKNLMAVEDHLLGQQVRCPHCQQVVVVPGSTPSTPPSSEPTPPSVSGPMGFSSFPVDFPSISPSIGAPHHEEDIFMPPAHASDDLFGGMGQHPAVEMPPERAGEQGMVSVERSEVEPAPPLTTPEPSAAGLQSAPATEILTLSPPELGETAAPSSSVWPETPSSAATSELPLEAPGGNLTR